MEQEKQGAVASAVTSIGPFDSLPTYGGRLCRTFDEPFQRWLLVDDGGHVLQSCIGLDIAQRYQAVIAVPTEIVVINIAAAELIAGSRHPGSAGR
jgi:hypothetical protein